MKDKKPFMKSTAPMATTVPAVHVLTKYFHPNELSSIRMTKPGNMNPIRVEAALPT